MTKGPTKVSPYSIPGIIANLAAGQVSIAARPQGPELLHDERVLERRARHRRGDRVDPPRQGATSWSPAAPRRPSRRSASAASRRCSRSRKRNDDPDAREPPVRQGPRRLRVRRGRAASSCSSRCRARRSAARRIYAEVTGYGASSDAYHLTQPAPDGEGAQRAMRMALEDAQARARRRRLRQRARHLDARRRHRGVARPSPRSSARTRTDKKLWVSSTKSMMGHLLGAAGAVESAVCALAHRRGRDPADDQPRRPGPRVPPRLRGEHGARAARSGTRMNNSFGFGGTNCSLLFSLAFERRHVLSQLP